MSPQSSWSICPSDYPGSRAMPYWFFHYQGGILHQLHQSYREKRNSYYACWLLVPLIFTPCSIHSFLLHAPGTRPPPHFHARPPFLHFKKSTRHAGGRGWKILHSSSFPELNTIIATIYGFRNPFLSTRFRNSEYIIEVDTFSLNYCNIISESQMVY